MCDGVGPFPFGDFNLATGDQRPGDGSAEQIRTFVDGIGAKHRENIVADEGFAKVLDVHLTGAHFHRLGLHGPHVLTLTEVGTERDHLVAEGLAHPL